MRDISDLRQRQALPLRAKVLMSQNKIREWYDHWNGDVCISFSGGKDSTVLTHLVHELYPEVPLVFANTGLEYPEVQKFAREMGAEFVRPKMQFSEVISTYGYPIISKETADAIEWSRHIIKEGVRRKYITQKRNELLGNRKAPDGGNCSYNKRKYLELTQTTQFNISPHCCAVMKKRPINGYCKSKNIYPYIGVLAEESRVRTQKWIQTGCNAFDAKKKVSTPMAFWTEQDVLKYIKQEGIEIASVYGDIVSVDGDGMEYEPMPGAECQLICSKCERTGCIFCGFGAHLDKGESRFQRLAVTHPKQYEYCMNGGQWVDNPEYDPAVPKMDGDWTNWNPKKIWVPSKEGLGMKKVFDDCNQIYGKDFIRYE